MERKNNKGVIFARYLWLYGEIASKGPVTFEAINEDWTLSMLNESREPLPHKTFENHRKAIEDMFNISIECDRTNNTYYIEQGSELNFAKATIEMLNGALLFQRIQANPQMSKYIRPEQCGNDSSLLFTIIDALVEDRGLTLLYRHNYDISREVSYQVKPIVVKQFRHRWYLIADLMDGRSYSFALDRIQRITKGDKVEPSTIDADLMFANSFGIIREDSLPAESIQLKVESEQANYFMSRPIHQSQTVVRRTDEYVIIGLKVAPTYDFIMELLSHGPKVEVLEPQSLRLRMGNMIKEMSNLYSTPQS